MKQWILDELVRAPYITQACKGQIAPHSKVIIGKGGWAISQKQITPLKEILGNQDIPIPRRQTGRRRGK